MKELLERLRGATGADRELDTAICAALGVIDAARYGLAEGYRYAPLRVSEDGLKVEQWVSHDSKPEARMFSRSPQPITASLDAALALVERVLPGASWLVSHVVRSRWSKHAFWATCGSGAGKYEAYAPAAPLALLIALLGALGAVSEASVQSTDEDRKTNNNPSLSKPNQ